MIKNRSITVGIKNIKIESNDKSISLVQGIIKVVIIQVMKVLTHINVNTIA
jgi:hypothetical protein